MKMKKLIAIIISVLMLAMSLPVQAASTVIDDISDAIMLAELSAFWNEFDNEESKILETKAEKAEVVRAAFEAVKHNKRVASTNWIDDNGFEFILDNGIKCVYDYNVRNAEFESNLNDEVLAETVCQKGTTDDCDVLVIGPYYGSDTSFTNQYRNEAVNIASYTTGTASELVGEAATGRAVAAALNDYGVVILDSHGVSAYGTSYFCLTTTTGIVTADYVNGYAVSLSSGGAGIDGNYMNQYKDGTLPSSIIWTAICEGMKTSGLCAPLRSAGAAVVYGYSQSVTFYYDYRAEAAFWSSMRNGNTVATSMANMKATCGNYDTYSDAYPIVVSAEDAYPSNPDSVQTVNSSWKLPNETPLTLNTVLNAAGSTLNFTTTGTSWIVDTTTYPTRTTAHTNVANSTVRTTVTVTAGDALHYSINLVPGTTADTAKVYRGTELVQTITTTGWGTYAILFYTSGTFTVSWEYSKLSTAASTTEGVWLDEVSLVRNYRCIVSFMDGVSNTSIKRMAVVSGDPIVDADFPTPRVHTGYNFTGWSRGAGIITANTTIIAQYTAVEYNVTLVDGVTGDTIDVLSVEHGDNVDFPVPPTHTGYTFSEWSSDGKNITGDTTITANYAKNKFFITYIDSLSGNIIGVEDVLYGEDADDFPTVPNHSGYYFTGWSSDGKNITSDMTITAYFAKIEYTVTFVDGITGDVIDTQTVAHGDAVQDFPTAPEHEGYTFTGWSSTGENITADTTITAEYNRIQYTVTYVDGLTDEVIATEIVMHGDDATEFPFAPAHVGYTFTGWSSTGKNITADTTITANYEINEYTVTYKDSVTNETLGTETVIHGENAINFPTVPEHEGYTFIDWSSTGENITSDTTITANFERIQYTVSYVDSITSEVYATEIVLHGDNAIDFPTAPTHEGYTFSDWDSNGENVTSDITITANYRRNEYAVTYIDGVSNSIIGVETVFHGEDAVNFPSVPEYDNYTFVGWSSTGENITSDTTITANYELNEYTVTYIDGLTNETLGTEIVLHGENAINFPAVPEHENYTFTGWSSTGENITEDTTITANYESDIVIVTITFIDGYNGDTISEAQVEEGSTIEEFPEVPEHDGYVFMGWDGADAPAVDGMEITARYLALGDVTGDGNVNTGDAVMVLRFSVGIIDFSADESKVADANQDGTINTGDAVVVLRIVVGLE